MKSNNSNLIIKLKVENFHSQLKSHITKQLLTSIYADIRSYLILNVILNFSVDKSSCLPH